MSSRVWFFRIEDILDALERIDQYVQGTDLNQFKSDRRTIDAVVRSTTDETSIKRDNARQTNLRKA